MDKGADADVSGSGAVGEHRDRGQVYGHRRCLHQGPIHAPVLVHPHPFLLRCGVLVQVFSECSDEMPTNCYRVVLHHAKYRLLRCQCMLLVSQTCGTPATCSSRSRVSQTCAWPCASFCRSSATTTAAAGHHRRAPPALQEHNTLTPPRAPATAASTSLPRRTRSNGGVNDLTSIHVLVGICAGK